MKYLNDDNNLYNVKKENFFFAFELENKKIEEIQKYLDFELITY